MSGNPYSPPSAKVADVERETLPLQRPSTVTLGIRLLCVDLVLAVAEIAVDGFPGEEDADGQALSDYLIGLALTVGVLAAMVLFTWFAWKGRNWARIGHLVALILGVLAVLLALAISYLIAPELPAERLEIFDAWMAVQTLLNIAGVMLLFSPTGNAWYRAMKAARRAS